MTVQTSHINKSSNDKRNTVKSKILETHQYWPKQKMFTSSIQTTTKINIPRHIDQNKNQYTLVYIDRNKSSLYHWYSEKQRPTYLSLLNERKVDYCNDIGKNKYIYRSMLVKNGLSIIGIEKNKNQYIVAYWGKMVSLSSVQRKTKINRPQHTRKKWSLYHRYREKQKSIYRSILGKNGLSIIGIEKNKNQYIVAYLRKQNTFIYVCGRYNRLQHFSIQMKQIMIIIGSFCDLLSD